VENSCHYEDSNEDGVVGSELNAASRHCPGTEPWRNF